MLYPHDFCTILNLKLNIVPIFLGIFPYSFHYPIIQEIIPVEMGPLLDTRITLSSIHFCITIKFFETKIIKLYNMCVKIKNYMHATKVLKQSCY